MADSSILMISLQAIASMCETVDRVNYNNYRLGTVLNIILCKIQRNCKKNGVVP